jgi:hypothetical protein
MSRGRILEGFHGKKKRQSSFGSFNVVILTSCSIHERLVTLLSYHSTIFFVCVSVRSHSWIACRSRAQRPSVLCHDLFNRVIGWVKTQEDIALTQETGPGM